MVRGLIISLSLAQILSGVMNVQPAPAATPTFSPAAGAVSNPTTVTASSASGCSTHIYEDTSNPPTTLQNTFSVTTAETVYAQVRGCPGFGNSAVGSAAYTIGGGCTLVDAGLTPNDQDNVSSSAPYVGYKFTPSSSFSLSQISVAFETNGSAIASGSVSFQIQTDVSSTPSGSVLGTTLGSSVPTFDISTLTSSPTYHALTFSSPIALTSGTPYWVVAVLPATTPNLRVSENTTAGKILFSTDDSTWGLTSNETGAVKTYSGTCP